MGFAAAAYWIGTISEKGKSSVLVDIFAMVSGTLIIYVFGVSWLKFVTGMSLSKAIAVGMLPFLIGDALKITVAIPVAKALRPMLSDSIGVLAPVE